MTQQQQRHPGRRWEIVFGSYEGVQQFAVNELQRMVQRYVPYVVAVRAAAPASRQTGVHRLLVGTPQEHPEIAGYIREGLVAAPQRPQGYAIACFDCPADAEGRVACIAGYDARGVLYGVEAFNAHVLGLGIAEEKAEGRRRAFDALGEVKFQEAPAIENRGIWTWGYVIYDYRRFLDNMARLRMNMLTMWNDCPPVNCREVIDYAHSRGIRVILGFHWGWGVSGLDLFREVDRRHIREVVLENYRSNYRDLPADGIYFQTLTEHNVTEKDGLSTAGAACRLVNDVSRELFAERPDLYIQFGLHATSIREHYADLGDLDERIVIVWEDAGGIPFSYTSVPRGAGDDSGEWNSPEGTLAYAKKLATFRKCGEFAMVPKGWINLRWGDEFEHHGPFVLGERDPEFVAERLRGRQRRWDQSNAQWMRAHPYAVRFYRELLGCGPGKVSVTALVEDGCFEQAIQPSVALFAEMIWDPHRDEHDLLQCAMSPYYGIW